MFYFVFLRPSYICTASCLDAHVPPPSSFFFFFFLFFFLSRLQKVGKLFIERNNINLHADILDDPEFFWEQDRYKHVYEKLFKYLELGKRVGLLNKRLGIMKELFDMIRYVALSSLMVIYTAFYPL